MPKMKLITIKFYRSTGYSYETDSFQNFMSRVWNAFDKKLDELVRKYNGSSIIDSFVHKSRSDHDGEEGFFEETLRCPEADANGLIKYFASLGTDSDVTQDKSEVVEYKKAKPLTEAQLVYRRYRGKIYFAFPSVKCYEQHYVNGKATEYVLYKPHAPITKANFFKMFDGVFSKYDHCPFEVAVFNKKFVSKLRQDAKLLPVYRTSLHYNMGIANLMRIRSMMYHYAARFFDFYIGSDWTSCEKCCLSDEVKLGIVNLIIAEKRANLAKRVAK